MFIFRFKVPLESKCVRLILLCLVLFNYFQYINEILKYHQNLTIEFVQAIRQSEKISMELHLGLNTIRLLSFTYNYW